ncbi:MAG TPA: D-glycero-beta-D-manno-heptose-7-phosphate kinase [Chthoniobacterales bacterium]|nr:D-glycero-beta-D-manno-heptose-7-phosphate kinase [Chthoniobacterales bacterium]
MTADRVAAILAQAASKRVLVIGDLMLDEFVWGKVGRISPEAPVPVVEVTGESFYPGGAANVARNLRDFVAATSVVGLIGEDRGGRQLCDLLEECQIGTDSLIREKHFPTIVKTRIIARQQQVVRVDREQIRPPSSAQIAQVIERIRAELERIDAVIFEDYGKGFLSAELIGKAAQLAAEAGKVVTADPNPHHVVDWRNMTAVKPNRNEAFIAAGLPARDLREPVETDPNLRELGRKLLEKWDTRYLLITLGEQGMMLFDRQDSAHHIPTRARQVFDVSGAGDTAIALFTLALCCDATAREAAEIANRASAVVVGKLGTATVTREELLASFDDSGD